LEFFKIKNIEREIKNKNKKRSKRKQPPSFLFPFPSLHGVLDENSKRPI